MASGRRRVAAANESMAFCSSPRVKVKIAQVIVGGPVIRPGREGSQQFLVGLVQAVAAGGVQQFPGVRGQGRGGPQAHQPEIIVQAGQESVTGFGGKMSPQGLGRGSPHQRRFIVEGLAEGRPFPPVGTGSQEADERSGINFVALRDW